jgi:hypothetical protein
MQKNKRKVLLITVSIGISLFLSGILSPKVSAWDDCPLGEVNDEYPGECPRYVDTDNNGICDQSEPAPEDRADKIDTVYDEAASDSEDNEKLANAADMEDSGHEDNNHNEYEDENQDEHEEIYSVEISGQDMKKLTIKEIADLWEIDADELLNALIDEFSLQEDYSSSDTLDILRAEYRFSPSEAKAVAESIKIGENFDPRATNIQDNNNSTLQTQGNATEKDLPYNFPIPFLVTALLYITTWQLSKSEFAKQNKLFNKIGFNGLWNTILAIALIPSFIFGLVLIMRYRFDRLRDINFDFLYWHVEGSIVMGTIGILHLLTRLKQYFAQLDFIGKNLNLIGNRTGGNSGKKEKNKTIPNIQQ